MECLARFSRELHLGPKAWRVFLANYSGVLRLWHDFLENHDGVLRFWRDFLKKYNGVLWV